MPAPRLDLLVVGHLNVDAEVRVPHLPGGDRTVPVLSRRESLGGTAANISRWASLLGLGVSLAAFVGPDVPPSFLARLRSDGVGLGEVRVRRGEFTPTCWIFEDGRGGQMAVIDQGAMRDTALEPLPTRALGRAKWVHVTTGDPTYQIRVAEAARERNVPVACDPAQEVHYRWSGQDLRRVLASSEILFGNEMEVAAARRLLKARTPTELLRHVPQVVMTRGRKGARAYTRRGTIDVPASKIRHFHRVTGAGDAFRGAFYRGWLRGEPLERCLRWGAAGGAAAVEIPHGPAGELPPPREVTRRVGGGRP